MITQLQVNSVNVVDGIIYENTDSHALKTTTVLIQVVNTGMSQETVEMWIRDNVTNQKVVCLLPSGTPLTPSEVMSDESPHNVMAGQHIYYEVSSPDVMIEVSLSEGHW